MLLIVVFACLELAAASARVPTVQPGPDAGRIIGTVNAVSRDLNPVRVTAIDGVNLAAPRDVIWLPPGKYTLSVQGLLRQSNPTPGSAIRSGSRRGEPGRSDIDVVVEAGKSYFLVMRLDRQDRDTPYSVLLHRVEEH